MNALLAYGTSSSDSEEGSDKETSAGESNDKPKLPKPTLGENALQTSVFSNPFVEAELAKAAILEKHVKMVPGKNSTHMINGKKICWNYRKGRCRFGHNCKYAHDSDIQKTQEDIEAENQRRKIEDYESAVTSAPPQHEVANPISSSSDSVWEAESEKKKLKRPGLSQSIVPGKKVLKIYKEQKIKDSIKKHN